MTARLTFRPERPIPSGDEVGTKSDVWPLRPSVRPQPSPIAFVIHDAKNMLAVLSANVEVLRDALADQILPIGAEEVLADIDESSRRLASLLRGALADLQGQAAERAEPCALHIAPVVASVVERMRPAARALGVSIAQAGDDDVSAAIEPELFERVLVNLLENAVRFSKPGDTIEVEYAFRAGRMSVAVGDRGPGVAESDREMIFESYRSRKPERGQSNFGLGLAFCRGVARTHGGDAWVFNRAGGGACFVFETL